MDVQFFKTDKGTTAFKQKLTGSAAGIFFLPGHRNTFDSRKCQLIEKLCQENDISYTHFAYFGWEQSISDDVPEAGQGYTHHWLEQAIALMDAKTTGSQILVGYSMGGYLALGLAQARPDRVKGIIGLAAGFGSGLVGRIVEHYGEKYLGTLDQKIFSFDMNDDFGLPIHEKLDINCPIYLAHAMADTTVNYQNTHYIAEAVTTENVVIHITKDGTHQLNRPEDEEWLEQTIRKLAL